MRHNVKFINLCIPVIVSLLAAISVNAQVEGELMKTMNNSPTTSEKIYESYEIRKSLKENSIFKGLHWIQSGPFDISGRISDIEVDPKDSHTFYAAGASGGVFKTINNGSTWESIFDSAPTLSIGDIAIDKNDNNIIYIGTGESNIARSTANGSGVYKTVNGGITWEYIGLGNTQQISRIIIDPNNSSIVYVAAMGPLFTQTSDKGIYKTENGGKTWEKIFYINETSSATDLVIHPKNSNILYAAFTEKDRRPWNLTKGGENSGVYKSIDGGKTWKRLLNGLPKNHLIGRVGIDISKKDPDILYAFIDNQNPRGNEDQNIDPSMELILADVKGAEIYRSNNSGNSWNKTHSNFLPKEIYYSYGYNFGQIRINPNDSDEIYLLGVRLYKSVDGGKTVFRTCNNNVHVDHHAMWINPVNPNNIILGTDGGVYISYDSGKNWDLSEPLPLGQYYKIEYDNQIPYNIYGGFQDHGIVSFSSKDRMDSYKPTRTLLFTGDGADVDFPSNNDSIVYAGTNFGLLYRLNLKDNTRKFIMPKAEENEKAFRFFYYPPFFISKYNPSTLYMGGNKLLKSENRGDSWYPISPDLTTNPEIQGNYPYGTITALSESPLKKGIIYVGTDDGKLWITKDDGRNWKPLQLNIPNHRFVTSICASADTEGRAYFTINGDKMNDYSTYLFVTNDFGETIKLLVNNLPNYEPVNVIKESPFDPNILYLGTNGGIYISYNQGKEWHSLHANMPDVPVFDIKIHPVLGDLIVGTHGRSAYILENGINKEILNNEDVLIQLPINAKIKTSQINDEKYLDYNPYIYVNAHTNNLDVKIEVFESNGYKIYSETKCCVKGINQFEMDFNKFYDWVFPEDNYKITVSYNNKSYTKNFELKEK